ncbi:MAG: 16S rRNA (cytosine(967)-C(5))-methyltransferase RsmB [Solirubrobacteraceae bacterium]
MSVLTVSPARAVAFAVVDRVFEDGAWADRALIGETRRAGLDPRDRALATQLAFGTVQRAATLDHVIGLLAGRPPADLDPAVRNSLRLGLFQLAFLERVPDHAAVGESVELAKAASPRGAGLVNAVLRRGAREARALIAALPDGTPEQAALRHSHPEWIARLWFEQLGPEAARALMAAGNRPPEPVLRANTLRTTRDALAAALPVGSRPAPGLPDALVLEAPFDAHGSELYAQGHFMPQSRAAQAVAQALDPKPGDRVLDCCAAPGGKATHLAALGARVVAVERDPGRARLLEATAARMGADVEVRVADATTLDEPGGYDGVLVDPPCSDLGTLALRPDARWRKQPGDPARLAQIQAAILAAAARTVRPGGVIVYSTCTISPEENERQLEHFLAAHPAFTLAAASQPGVWDHPRVPGVIQTLPHRDHTDGFFIARLRKEAK